jgi:tetratricopeptide (TPR) repeat protein
MVVHSVPYMGKATDRKGSMIGSVLLRADMSYAIPSNLIRKWLLDHHIPHETTESTVMNETQSRLLTNREIDSELLGMSLFLTGHLVQTIADTINSDQEFMELAMNHYQKALEIFPGKAVIAKNLALTYRSLHRYQDALNIYESLLQQSSSDLLLLTEAAQVFQDLHMEEKAIAKYRTVLEYDSCYLDALNGLGNIYLGKHDYGNAVLTFRQAVTCKPSSAYASFYLGESMARSGLVEEAHAVWKGSLERVRVHTLQEKEFFDLMRERTVVAPALLPRAALLTTTGNGSRISAQ